MFDIHCPRCHSLIAQTFSSEPLPGIYHPDCAREEEEEDAIRELENAVEEDEEEWRK